MLSPESWVPATPAYSEAWLVTTIGPLGMGAQGVPGNLTQVL